MTGSRHSVPQPLLQHLVMLLQSMSLVHFIWHISPASTWESCATWSRQDTRHTVKTIAGKYFPYTMLEQSLCGRNIVDTEVTFYFLVGSEFRPASGELSQITDKGVEVTWLGCQTREFSPSFYLQDFKEPSVKQTSIQGRTFGAITRLYESPLCLTQWKVGY